MGKSKFRLILAFGLAVSFSAQAEIATQTLNTAITAHPDSASFYQKQLTSFKALASDSTLVDARGRKLDVRERAMIMRVVAKQAVKTVNAEASTNTIFGTSYLIPGTETLASYLTSDLNGIRKSLSHPNVKWAELKAAADSAQSKWDFYTGNGFFN